MDGRARQHLKVLYARRAELRGLRVMVTAGGCSGFQYVFRPETRVNDDDQLRSCARTRHEPCASANADAARDGLHAGPGAEDGDGVWPTQRV